MLQNMYRAFDYIAELTGAYKIETIGDAYFAVVTLHDKSISAEESCFRIAIFAQAVRAFIRGPFGQIYNIHVRVGLHTGDLVAGVLGDLRPRFVLVGDTVNTASRMETSAEPDTINVSATSAELLRKYFALTPRPLAEVKGKGVVQMYELGDAMFDECPFGLLSPSQLALIALQQLQDFHQKLSYRHRMGDSVRALFSRSDRVRRPSRSGGTGGGSGQRGEVLLGPVRLLFPTSTSLARLLARALSFFPSLPRDVLPFLLCGATSPSPPPPPALAAALPPSLSFSMMLGPYAAPLIGHAGGCRNRCNRCSPTSVVHSENVKKACVCSVVHSHARIIGARCEQAP